MARNPVGEGPVWRRTRDYWDAYNARLHVLGTRYPHLSARELHYRSLPPVANEAPAAAPSKPTPPKTMASRIWPNLK
jgi:hypothetical protein